MLLGSGASADAGLPTTIGLTDAVIDRVSYPDESLILEFIRHTLAAELARPTHRISRGDGGYDVSVDVERLFAAVDLLVARHEQPWSPFVASWHPGLESFTPPRRLTEFELSSQLNSFDGALHALLSRVAQSGSTRPYLDMGSVRRALSGVVAGAVALSRPSDVSELLERVRGEMLRSLFGVLRIDDPAAVAYLLPLTELARAQGVLRIATLNYDRAVENAAELAGDECDTLIETWLERGALELPDSGLQLLKLHGSIDWVFEGGMAARQLPRQQIRKVDEEEEKARYDRPAVVFGEGGKLRAEGPFLELLLAWATALRQADNLLIIGYSFRDQHVNELIARWFNNNERRRIILLSPDEVEASTHADFGWHLKQVDADKPKPRDPRSCRFQHVVGRTKEALPAAIAAAVSPLHAVDSSP